MSINNGFDKKLKLYKKFALIVSASNIYFWYEKATKQFYKSFGDDLILVSSFMRKITSIHAPQMGGDALDQTTRKDESINYFYIHIVYLYIPIDNNCLSGN